MTKEPTVKQLTIDAARDEPAHVRTIYAFVCRMRPGTANETIRARIYEALKEGKVARIAEGVYLAVDGPATMLVVQGDAWEALQRLDAGVLDLIVTDPPFDLGTKQNAESGTTRLKTGKRSYEQRDLDEAWLRAAHRALKAAKAWRSFGASGEQEAGGALVILTPAVTETTWPHIQALVDLARKLGFSYRGQTVWDTEVLGMGYSFGRTRHMLLHLFQRGERAGMGWDLATPNVLRHKALRHASGGDEHEAEKPVGLFLDVIRFLTRPGDVVMDPFAGRARWAREALREGRHVILTEAQSEWVERIAQEA